MIAQIAADAVGLPIDAVELVGPDTGITPDGIAAFKLAVPRCEVIH